MTALRRSSAAGVLHGQAVARRVGIKATDLECLDLILVDGPATAGEIARRTGLTSGAVTGLIDRLEHQGWVERTADPQDRRKVVVQVRFDKISSIAALYAPMQQAMENLLAAYSEEQLALITDFAERSAEILLGRTRDLNDKA